MMRATTLLVLPALFTGSTAPSPVPAQDQAASWTPPIPLQGSLLRVAVPAAPPPLDTVPPAASLADEPLHFTRETAGGWTALAAVPLAAGDSVILWLRPAGRAESVAVRVPVTLRPTGVERLGTDPEFTAPLDSALAERVRREAESVAACKAAAAEKRCAPDSTCGCPLSIRNTPPKISPRRSKNTLPDEASRPSTPTRMKVKAV